jgi:ethanolaminephosphotransferase
MSSLTEEEKDHVRNYKFTGGDLSLLYQHVLTHWSQWCNDTFIPAWMAPNMITLIGLIVSTTAAAVTVYVHPSLAPGTPRWVGIMSGISLFAYQTLDSMDGKQARKTGSSSALGMLFDHGCDAINAGVSVMTMGAVMGTGWTGKLYMPYFAAFLPFYVQTWEEYYTGTMIFPMFNGPTQGILMAVGVCFIQAYIGNEKFHEVILLFPFFWLSSNIHFFLDRKYTVFQRSSYFMIISSPENSATLQWRTPVSLVGRSC